MGIVAKGKEKLYIILKAIQTLPHIPNPNPNPNPIVGQTLSTIFKPFYG